MTKEQAIEFLKEYTKINFSERCRDAHNIAIKALEQQPSDDVIEIHTQGLAEGIRCAMCTNSMKSDRGCDGGCVVDEDMYKKVMDTIKNHIFNQPTSDDCVSRQAVDLLCFKYLKPNNDDNVAFYEHFLDLPPVMPTFPKDTTNGDMIKAMFPKIEIYTDVINEIVDVEICEDSSELRCSVDWWNAPYKRGSENE